MVIVIGTAAHRDQIGMTIDMTVDHRVEDHHLELIMVVSHFLKKIRAKKKT